MGAAEELTINAILLGGLSVVSAALGKVWWDLRKLIDDRDKEKQVLVARLEDEKDRIAASLKAEHLVELVEIRTALKACEDDRAKLWQYLHAQSLVMARRLGMTQKEIESEVKEESDKLI